MFNCTYQLCMHITLGIRFSQFDFIIERKTFAGDINSIMPKFKAQLC